MLINTCRRSIDKSLNYARLQNDLSEHGRRNRMGVLLLVGNATQSCCAVQNFKENLASSTPIDMYIFSKQNAAERLHKKLNCSLDSHSMNNYFMALDEHWETPEEANETSLWMSGFSEDYMRMGHWRLTFQMEFAVNLGYQYILQLDDDSRFLSRVDLDLLQYMRDNKVMAARHVSKNDPLDVITGAAELARYFLVAERIQPTTLYNHCTPHNISGLYTLVASHVGDDFGHPEDGGYSAVHLYGNFVVIDLDFWFDTRVQRFVRLVLGTGGHFRFRWNEQLVESMVWQIFVHPKQFATFSFDYAHGPENRC